MPVARKVWQLAADPSSACPAAFLNHAIDIDPRQPGLPDAPSDDEVAVVLLALENPDGAVEDGEAAAERPDDVKLTAAKL